MISLDAALALVGSHADSVAPLCRERVSLWSARGRVLAETVQSAVALPSADYSAMDGYAVRAGDFSSSAETTLQLRGECQTGYAGPELKAGGCLRIFTGAHIPEGADSVIMQENAVVSAAGVTFARPPKLGENIRRKGEDVEIGAQLLSAGTRLLPHQLGLLASAEKTEVLVARRPRVTIVCTGDELRPFGSTFYGGQLAESNSIALMAMCEEAGAESMRSALVLDKLPELEQSLLAATEQADVVITVGGVSVGDHDLVRPAILGIGGEIIFHKVAIKPGKPVLFARKNKTLILGLPGNPASAQVVFSLLGIPLLRRLVQDNRGAVLPRSAQLSHAFSHKSGRRSFYRARLEGDQVTVLSNQASGATTSMAWANALLEMSESCSSYELNERVPVWAFSDF